MTTPRLLSAFTLTLQALVACAVPAEPDGAAAPAGGKADGASAVRGLPASLAPWGGADAARWTPEAIVANAVTSELQRDPSARVSVPLALAKSQHAPFGDGQTNAAASLAFWQGSRPPVIATRSGGRLAIRFDRTLPFGGDTFELWTPAGTWVMSVPSTRTPEGDWLVELAAVPAALAHRLVVSPRGWRDGFPLAFELPVTSIAQLAGSLPADQRVLPGGEPVIDPVGAAEAAAGTTTVADLLRGSSFPAGWNQVPFVTGDLHAAFPQGSVPRVTAVGGAETWLTEAPFKNLYVCLERRDLAGEATYAVPSGAGWHHIGDAGESLLASLEDSPLLVGHSAGAPLAPPAAGGFAYGLERAATFALLQPGQAFTTPRGDFHWYAVHHDVDPCVQIWVHRCAPDAAAPSMACPL